MDQVLFEVDTEIKKEDLRKFLYIATFMRSPYNLLIIIVISFIGAIGVTWDRGIGSSVEIFLAWIILILTTIVFLMWKVERINKKKSKVVEGNIYNKNNLKFYEGHMDIKGEDIDAAIPVRYEQIFQILESKEYIILYFTKNAATLIRKMDLVDSKKLSLFLQGKLNKRYIKTLIG